MADEVLCVLSRWARIIAVLYMVAAFYRIFPDFEIKEVPSPQDHVPYGCMDPPLCAIQARTAPAAVINSCPQDQVCYYEQAYPEMFNILKREPDPDDKMKLQSQFDSERAPVPLTEQEEDLDPEQDIVDAYLEKTVADKEHDPQALTLTTEQPHRQFKRAIEGHFEMVEEREEEREQHRHYHSDAGETDSEMEWKPYEKSRLLLALRVTFVISSSLLGLSLLIGNECGARRFFSSWLISAGASTALDVGLLIAVAVTEETRGGTTFHYVFLGLRAFSFFIVNEKRRRLKKTTLPDDRRPIVFQHIESDEESLNV